MYNGVKLEVWGGNTRSFTLMRTNAANIMRTKRFNACVRLYRAQLTRSRLI